MKNLLLVFAFLLGGCCAPCVQRDPSPFDSVKRPAMNRDCNLPHWNDELLKNNITKEEHVFLVDGCEEAYQ